jgi:NADH-quinone oxidoreductase subunit N
MGFPIVGGAGFLAKWFIVKAALQAPAPQYALSVVLVLTTVISAGYYLYVIMVMFMRPRSVDAPAVPQTRSLTRAVMVSTAALLIILGLAPDLVVRYANVGYPSMQAPRAARLTPPPAPTAVAR